MLINDILTNQISNNEWYTPIEVIKEMIINERIRKDKVIWCPFDNEESNFVKVLRANGNKVILSHIENNEDFFTWEPKEQWDMIISNPPFTKKRLLIERALSFNKPFILLYGCSIFSQTLGNTLNKCKFNFIQKQVEFKNKENAKKKFLCVWIKGERNE